MDPDNPRPRDRSDPRSLTRVQHWVMSTLVVSLILHLAGGLVLGAYVMDDDRLDGRIGLVAIAGVLGFLSVVAALAIHGRHLVSWWLVAGLLPALVFVWIVFG